MSTFTLFNNCIIIIIDDDKTILDIYNLQTNTFHNRIGSRKQKYIKFKEFQFDTYTGKIFNSLDELKKHHNINNDIVFVGYYNSTSKCPKKINKKFFHINYKKNGIYEETSYWHPLYQTKRVSNYIDGILQGDNKIFENDLLQFHFKYVNGILNGEYLEYYYTSEKELDYVVKKIYVNGVISSTSIL